MSSIHDVFKDEEVSGEIVGDVLHVANLFYEGRHQGQKVCVRKDSDAIELLSERKTSLLRENPHCYLNKSPTAWEVRIF